MNKGKLTLLCGKMGAGKSTKAAEIAALTSAVLVSEDEWLAALYPKMISSLTDYVEYSNRLKPPIKGLIQSVLIKGTPVVMDFPANTVAQRAWLKTIFADIQAPHELLYLEVPDAVCLAQIRKRGIEQPHRAATDTVEMFEQVTKHFQAPSEEEGFDLILVR